MDTLKTSEFWMGLVAAILAFLVQQHVLTEEVAGYAKMAAVYAAGRIISKTVTPGAVPFQPAPKPVVPPQR